jgi:nucleoside 2-deoxyribosyltransferase
MKYVYVAGPLFNAHERWYLERITAALEEAGYRTFLPHRDAGLVTLRSSEERARIFKIDLDALNAADLIVALLTGADHDSGTSAELGYMYALGKPCFGINDDKRGALNNIIWGICGNGQRIAGSIDELLSMIQQS